MNVMPPPGQTMTGAPPAVTVVSACRTERVSRTGFSVTPARSEPPAPAMNRTEQSAGSQFSLMRSTDSRKASGSSASIGRRCLVEPVEGVLLAGGRDHQHASGRATRPSG